MREISGGHWKRTGSTTVPIPRVTYICVLCLL